jgi:predicted RNase H-like HicB family nuclease
MEGRYILTDYVEHALALANYEKLDDGTFCGRIPDCPGVIAFGSNLRKCRPELRSVLEDWILVGLKLGHTLPVIAGIDLNQEPRREPVESL